MTAPDPEIAMTDWHALDSNYSSLWVSILALVHPLHRQADKFAP